MESFDQVTQFRNEPYSSLRNTKPETARTRVPVRVIHEESVYETIDDEKNPNILAYKDNSVFHSDLRFITELPEMCDVTFLVGRHEVPVYGVKALLATRCSVFYNMIVSTDCHRVPKNKSTGSRLVSSIKRLANPRRKPVCKSQTKQVYRIPEFEPSAFRPVISFLHSGDVHLDVNNVIDWELWDKPAPLLSYQEVTKVISPYKFENGLGVMVTADAFHLDDLRIACINYARECITRKTVLQLLGSAQPYISHKWCKIINLEVMTYICKKGQDLIQQPAFFELSEEAVSRILSRTQLRVSEGRKWEAALRWTRINCASSSSKKFRLTLRALTEFVDFCDIPLVKLRTEIQPLRVVPDDIINRAISHQSFPRLVIGQEKESNGRRLSKQKGSTCLRNKPTTMTHRFNIKEQFPVHPLASSTFDNSKVLGSSDSGYALSFLDASLLSKL